MRKGTSLSLVLALLLFGVLGCTILTPEQKAEMYGPNPPRLVAAFAQTQMPFPTIWQIFLGAEDPDGDMVNIEANVRVAGGNFDFATVHIKPEMSRSFKGYVWLDLPVGSSVGFRTVTLTLWVVDRAEHRSQFAVFNLYTGEQMSAEEKAQLERFEKEYQLALGPIGIGLDFDGGGGNGSRLFR